VISSALIERLREGNVALSADGDELVVRAAGGRLDPELLGLLRENKPGLLALLRSDAYAAALSDAAPLVDLSDEQRGRIAAEVDGGADNVQDVYPLTPLQEGMLFHHLLDHEGDPYLLANLHRFASRERLEAWLSALNAVIARHDILRTAVVWEGVPEPVQVVWRRARLEVEEVEPDAAEGDAARALWTRFDPRRTRLDLRRAPLMRACATHDAEGRWLLLVQQHHMVMDHTTNEVLQGEIRAHLLGREAELPPALPFRTHVAAVRSRARGAGDEAYFRTLLGDVDAPTTPFGLAAAWSDGTGIEQGRLMLDAALAARIRERARVLMVSVSSVCHLAWALVVARASGTRDVVFGTVLWGRLQGSAGTGRVLGPFINTLPVRIRVDGEGVAASLRGAHAQLGRLLRHEHASLALAQRCSGVQAPAPLFTSLLNHRHGARAGAAPAGSPDAGAEGQRLAGEERTNYPLTLMVEDWGEALGLTAHAPASVGAARVCALMERALEALVEALQTAPGRPVATLDVLPQAERRQVVEEWNRTDAGYPRGACVHELFQAQAARTPDAVAVVCGGAALSYAELNRRANRLAHHLRALGVGPDARVGICVPRGVEMVVALLAVLKAGGAYLPLDPEYPWERLRYMLDDGAPRLLLTQGALAERFRGVSVPVLDLAGDGAAWRGQPEGDPERRGLAPENLAYVIYTSGSTGRPKGVMVAHRNAVNFLAWGAGAFRGRGLERTLFSTSLNFDLAVFECFVPLHAGATVWLVEDALALARGGAPVTLVNTVPSAMQALLDAGGVPAGVRTVNLAGEPLKRRLAGRIFAETGVERVCNLYGPSETTTYSTWVEMRRGEGFATHVGGPVANTRVYLLDGAGEPAPVGVAGEVYIGGAGVARGYWGRPALTAERFVPDPFAREPGARLYRTGDLGRWLPEGVVEFLGRNDAQVKIRGFRIEPGEVEARLVEHAGVREAAVVAREDDAGDRRLVAYWVGPGEVGVDRLRAHLLERLAEHMVPAAYVRLERLPLTPNGKLDRGALPAPAGDAYARRGYEAPSGDTEEALAEVWREVLRLGRVGRWDHFFELGGHSLLAVQVVSRVRQALGVELALGAVFEHPVLAALAGHLRELQLARVGPGTPAPAIEPVARSGPLPLSFAQARLWFLERMESGGAAYHISWREHLSGALDRAALVRALDRMVQRHEALRTTFAEVDGEPVQRIAPAGEGRFTLVEHDLGGRPGAFEALRRIAAEETGAPFSLERGPLVRGRLVRLAPDEHVLLVTMHHIVSDGWSMGVWATELGALYDAFRRGEPDPLPPLAVQYADYAAWQRAWVGGEVLRKQAEYWMRTLSGAPELLELPVDHPRPARWDPRGASLGWALDEAATSALKRLGQRHGTTLFMTLLAGWAVVLGRLSGQDEVVVGMPTANRGRREIEGLIGFFLNTLPLRVDLSGPPTVAELLARARARALEAQQNQDIPFEQVVERVRPVRSLAYAPLFQASFTWQSAPRGELALEGVKTLPSGVSGAAPRVTVRYDLSLNLQEAGGRVGGGVEYAASLFRAETVERWLGYLRTVLEAMAADDGRRVDRLPLLPEAERRALAEGSGSHAVARRTRSSIAHVPFAAAEAEQSIAARFRAQAAAHPERPALRTLSGEWSYRALDERAQRIARAVVASVGPGAGRVGLLFEPDAPMVASVLGALAAGKTYVPLDPAWPEARMRQVLDDAGATLVLCGHAGFATAQRLAASLRAGAAAVLQVERLGSVPPGAVPEISVDVPPEQLAYLLYTSGSTGEPKGVAQSHRNVLAHIRSYTNALGIGPDDRLTLLASYATDAAVMDLFGALLNGAALHLFDLWRGGVEALAPWLRAQHVTLYHSTPTLFRALTAEGGAAAEDRFPSVRLVVLGGEAVTRADFERFRERFTPGCVFVNGLGPTESTLALQCFMDHSTEPAGGAVPAGHAVEGAEVLLLDDAGEPVELLARGEIVVRSPHLALGYWGRPGLTARAFVPDPGGRGARMYRTGDLGRRLPDGAIEFLGRRDHQVKVRGYRVEPDEVAAALRRYPGVREAAVVPRPAGEGGAAALVAYFVADEPPAAGALRAHLAALLPEPMVPAAYVPLAALPLTSSGKLDRKALPAPGEDGYARRGYEAPAGDTEVALAEIWAGLLGVERVGRHDHFFELGGHSLLAVQVVSRVRRVLGVEVPLGEVFERPALADFARALEEGVRASLPPIEPVDRGGPLPLSFAQQRLWFLDRLEGGGAAYRLSLRLRLLGELDHAALRRALDRIVARHEALRTAFPERGGVPEQRIAAAHTPFHLVEHDLRAAPDGRQALHAVLAGEARARFDLAAGPLARGHLVRMADDDHVLLVSMHHIVSDGWSMGVLTRELSTLYGAFRRGGPDPLPPLPVQYADYAAWQRRWVEGEVLRRQAEYWQATLAGAPALLELPTDRPRPAVQDHAGGALEVELGEALTAELKALGRRQGTTLFMTLLAGWAALLGRLSGQDDVVIGTPTANRGRDEIEGLIGFFANTLALRVDLSDTPAAAELLERVKARALGAQAHQDIPFEKVVEVARPARSLAHSPLFQVMFAWQNAPGGRLELPGLSLAAPGPAGSGGAASQVTAKFDLSLTLFERGGRIVGTVEYAAALFDGATVARSLEYLRRVLEGMAADPARPVGSLPLLAEAERARLLEESRGPSRAWDAEACIDALFEARAARTPDAAAIVLGAATLTYAGLDRRAEAVAAALAARGIGRGSCVPILMERGLGVPVAMLGVMKSGAAFSPLDVRWPAARLRQVLDDLGSEVVLVDGALPFGEAELGRTFLPLPGEGAGDGPRERTGGERSPEDPLYVIYTSGSTGTPKGVLVPHRGIANRFRWMSETFGAAAAEAVLQTTRHVYDSAVWQLFWPLIAGGRSVMLAGDDELAAGPVAALVGRHGVTMTDFVPSVFNELVPRLVEDGEARRSLASLRVVVVGGEQITAATTYAFMERFPGVRVANLYGPTEASIGCIWHPVTGREGDRIPIGRPIANTHALVLDGGRGLVPAGVAGELYLSGACLGLGYLNDAEKTRAAFVDNPFPELGSARMYRTGDRVRRLAGGEIEFLGRVDQQVKVRGFRIEPAEVEAALLQHPGVREAVVLAREAAPGDRRLVGYVVPAGREGVAAASLRAHLGARLPDYMVPSAFVALESFPRTPGGKVDRGALPAPAWEAEAAYVPPRSPVEEVVAAIWAEVLGRDRVGVHDGFFELGGHSLLATRVISRVREAFGAEVPLRALFESPTVAGLGERVQAAVSAGGGPLLPLRRVPREGELALSFGQERLWTAWRREPGSAAYNLHYRLRLRGGVEASVLERALAEVVRRHESLRTTFRESGGRVVQVIHPAGPSPLRQVDLSGLAGPARDEAVQSLAAEETHRPFDLERGPLLRAVLARMGEGDFAFFLTLHHIVTDGWSTGVLMRELSALYAAFAAGDKSPLPEPEVQYADYAAWQRAWLTDELLERQLAWWAARLAGAPRIPALRTDRPRPPVPGDRAATQTFRLPEAVSAALRAFGRREGCTLYMALLAGFQALVSRYGGHHDVCVGTPVAGRVRRELEGLIGFFANTLVIRTDLAGSPGFRELLLRVREAALGAYAHQDLPFTGLVSALRPDCGPGEMPFFQVVFELEHARPREERLRLPAVVPSPLGGSPHDRHGLRSELRLTMRDDGTNVAGSLAYRTELFDPATIERMIADYLALLEGAVADPDRPVADLFPGRDS
jgi:syringomycin synthetase protein SyrE